MGDTSNGATFDLFAAPLEQANGYVGDGYCGVCDRMCNHCFTLGVGDDFIVNCPHCDEPNAVPSDEQGTVCTRCGTFVRPTRHGDGDLACAECLRSGRIVMTKGTEYGMVRWIDAEQGVTHGVPGLRPDRLGTNEFTLAEPSDEGWVRVRIPLEWLRLLIRTPTYPSIQGERWLFHCGRPMVYVGQWTRDDFDRESGGDGGPLFMRVVEDAAPIAFEVDPDMVGIYMFRCPACSALRGHWDLE